MHRFKTVPNEIDPNRSPTCLGISLKTWLECLHEDSPWLRELCKEKRVQVLVFCFSSLLEKHHCCWFLIMRCRVGLLWLRFASNDSFCLPGIKQRILRLFCCFCQELLRLMSFTLKFSFLGIHFEIFPAAVTLATTISQFRSESIRPCRLFCFAQRSPKPLYHLQM